MKTALLSIALCLATPFTLSGGKGATHKTGGNFNVEPTRGIAYREGPDADAARNNLDLFVPKGQKNFPVLMFVHGGTWKSGSKDLYAPLGMMLAKNGIGTVIINYRLSPKVTHPAHIEDVAKAFAWTHNNIAKYGGDPKNIFVCGHSAGGHLVSLLSTNETYLKAENLKLSDIKGTIAISGVYVLAPGFLAEVFTADKAVVKTATPIEHVTGEHPPCLMIYADKDYPTFDAQAAQMCKKLTDAKCEASVLKIDDRDHISIMMSMGKESDPTTQAVLEFVAKHGGLKLKLAK